MNDGISKRSFLADIKAILIGFFVDVVLTLILQLVSRTAIVWAAIDLSGPRHKAVVLVTATELFHWFAAGGFRVVAGALGVILGAFFAVRLRQKNWFILALAIGALDIGVSLMLISDRLNENAVLSLALTVPFSILGGYLGSINSRPRLENAALR